MIRFYTQYQIPLGQQLVYAVGEGNLTQIQELIRHPNISLHLHDVGQALMIAATKGFVEIIEVFLAQHYFKEIPVYYRGGAMRFAAKDNQYQVLLKLLDANCEEGVIFNGVAQCLMNAALEGHLEIVQLLFEKKNDHITFTHKKSALKLAMQYNYGSLIDYLRVKLQTDLNQKEIKDLFKEIRNSINREMESSNYYLSQYSSVRHQNDHAATCEDIDQYKKLSSTI